MFQGPVQQAGQNDRASSLRCLWVFLQDPVYLRTQLRRRQNEHHQFQLTAEKVGIFPLMQCVWDWENGQLFSIEEQIEHKVDFLKHEFTNHEATVVLVWTPCANDLKLLNWLKYYDQYWMFMWCHTLCLAFNLTVTLDVILKWCNIHYPHGGFLCFLFCSSSILSAALSALAAVLGLLPKWASVSIAKNSVGRSWSATAIEATCTHLLQYHTLRNVMFMAMTEFKKFSEEPDWTFIKDKARQIAFLFGIDDHWGPLSMFEEISKRAPDIDLSIEREGHTHSFCCSEAGSLWVAQYVATLIENKIGK